MRCRRSTESERVLLAKLRGGASGGLVAYFSSNTAVTDSGCWLWTGACAANGYGRASFEGYGILAHRLSYLAHTRKPLRGLCVLHKCDNPPCVNPEHLFRGTRGDNNRDCCDKGRHCRGSRMPNAQLTEGEVTRARNLYREGRAIRRIAAILGVRVAAVWRAIAGRRWAHVPDACVIHPRRGENNGRNKLTEQQVLAIAEERKPGVFASAPAKRYGVSVSTIQAIWEKRNWKHLWK